MTRVIGLITFEFEGEEDFDERDHKVRQVVSALDEHGKQIVKGFRILGPATHSAQREPPPPEEPEGDPERLFDEQSK
jgi:hypothetical protein